MKRFGIILLGIVCFTACEAVTLEDSIVPKTGKFAITIAEEAAGQIIPGQASADAGVSVTLYSLAGVPAAFSEGEPPVKQDLLAESGTLDDGVLKKLGIPLNKAVTAWTFSMPAANINVTFDMEDVETQKLNDASLASLLVNGIEFEFDPDKLVYDFKESPFENDKAIAEITALSGSEDAKININGGAAVSNEAKNVLLINTGDLENTIHILVTAKNAAITRKYTIKIYRKKLNAPQVAAPSEDTSLSLLTVSDVEFDFDSSIADYDLRGKPVDNKIGSVTITPEATQEQATITVNGSGLVSGKASVLLNKVGDDANKVTIQVTAPDGKTAGAYTLYLYRKASDDATLKVLSVSEIDFTFDPQTGVYDLEPVANSMSSVTVIPMVNHGGAVLTFNGKAVNSGVSQPLALTNMGSIVNEARIVVTAEDKTTTKTYLLKIYRQSRTNATLSSLTVSGQAFLFKPNVLAYEFLLKDIPANVTVTAQTADSDAVLKINGTAVVSGQGSVVPLSKTAKTDIPVLVTAQDGKTSLIYMISIIPDDNYWHDGQVYKINTHTKGNGYHVVIVGDGFDRSDLKKGGFWEIRASWLAKHFMKTIVIRDMLEYLDVWVLMSESKEQGIDGAKKDTKFGSYGATTDEELVNKIVKEIPGVVPDKYKIMFVANGPYPGWAIPAANLATMPIDEGSYSYWVSHEFIGHILTGMPDLYYFGTETPPVDSLRWNEIKFYQGRGEWYYLDVNNTPDTVIWKDFIGKKGYEDIGINATGGFYGYLVYMPTASSVMMGWSGGSYFSGPERYDIWRGIMQRAEMPASEYTLEKFFAWDVINHGCSSATDPPRPNDF